jgi:hypothetical protein
MRPLYETRTDKANEETVAALIARERKFEVRRAPPQHSYDYDLFRGGKHWGIMEIKCRNNPKHKYQTYHISKSKLDTCLNIAKRAGVRFILTVCWTDGVYCLPVSDLSGYEIKTGGRKDRGDAMDIEEMVHIPHSHFVPAKVRT